MGILLKLRSPIAINAAAPMIDGSGWRIDHAEMLSAINTLPLD
jgi:hypothetical protein